MYTRQDAVIDITEAIEATGVVEDAAAEFHLDAIADDLYTAAGDTWDVHTIDTSVFWWVVQRHAIDEEARAAAPAEADTPSPTTDEIADTLLETRERVEITRESLRTAEAERDALLVRTYRTGAYTQQRLAELGGVSRQRVAQILAR